MFGKSGWGDEIKTPDDYGITSAYYDEIFKNMKQTFLTNSFLKEESPPLKKEYKECIKLFEEVGSVVPGSMFFGPNEDLLDEKYLLEWFPTSGKILHWNKFSQVHYLLIKMFIF